MGIIKGREELIPVTCAVLKDPDREAFFSQIRQNPAGGPEALAKWLGVPVALINDWIAGRLHIPYHTLQNIAYQFSVEMPPVGELRRESLPAAYLPSAKRAESPPERTSGRREAPPERAAGSREAPRKERKPRREPRSKQPRKIRVPQSSSAAPSVSAGPTARAPHPAGHHLPKPSEPLAYWAGILYAAVSLNGDVLSFSADRAVGQNFAGLWARKTKELFGISSQLSNLEDGKVQKAECEIPGIAKFLARFCPGVGTQGAQSTVPRWIWSNQAWKSAFLKGAADVAARFQRKPALVVEVPSGIKSAVQKLMVSLGFKPQAGGSGAFLIAGREELERYFNLVGTENMKLRDQWESFRNNSTDTLPDEQAPAESATGDVAPPAESTRAEPAAHKPAHPKKHSQRRRTVYRGRPGQ